MSKYGIIYADPPWYYGDKPSGFGDKGNNTKGIQPTYQTMKVDEIKNLKVNKYEIIYADPPWHYTRNMDKASKRIKLKPGTRGINVPYDTMESEDIAALHVKDLLEEDAACFMWTTDAHLPSAIEIMKAWGFKYKTIAFVWEKQYANGNAVNMMAPWTNKCYEICLFGTKGAMTKHLGSNRISQKVVTVRGTHSSKPEEVAHRIEQMFPDLKKIELFARRHRPGWDVWGNDPAITNSITL